MRIIFHGDETFDYNSDFIFKKIPNGVYMVRTTVEPTDDDAFEAYDFQWPTALKDNTLTPLEIEIPRPNA